MVWNDTELLIRLTNKQSGSSFKIHKMFSVCIILFVGSCFPIFFMFFFCVFHFFYFYYFHCEAQWGNIMYVCVCVCIRELERIWNQSGTQLLDRLYQGHLRSCEFCVSIKSLCRRSARKTGEILYAFEIQMCSVLLFVTWLTIFPFAPCQTFQKCMH